MLTNFLQLTIAGNNSKIILFDVSALFPSVPVDIAIDAIETHLRKANETEEKIDAYVAAIRKCMKYNCFQFRNLFYESDFGCSMGNSLSPLVSEAFMCKFESDLKKENLLPRFWLRYVDDIFAVIKRNDIERFMNILNSRYESIKFTFETEDPIKQTLPILDLLITRVNGKLDFAVYRKSTSTDRFITNDSFCSHQNKLAAFHSMVTRIVRLPLSLANYKHEYDHIVKVADINGYEKHPCHCA